MARPLLLTYNLNPQTAEALKRLCDGMQIRCRAVQPSEYALPIGVLAGIPVAIAPDAAPAGGFNDAMLVICFMLSDQLDALLPALRQAGLSIPLKAVLTPSNVSWNSIQLHDELAREHALMRRKEIQ